MKAIAFIQSLKQTVLEIESNNSEHIFYVELDYELIRRIKKYAFDKLSEIQNKSLAIDRFTYDLLSRDIFNSRITYCIVKLKEFSIKESEYFDYISKAIDCFIKNRGHKFDRSEVAIKERLIMELSNCFNIWYRPDDIFLIRFSQDRQLIFVNPKQKNWQTSNLGRFFIELPYFEAVSFLCAIEIVLTLEAHKNAFISKALLDMLLHPNPNKDKPQKPRIVPYSLTLFGLFEINYNQPEQHRVTEFGLQVLSYVESHLKEFQEIIMSLLESEVVGLKYLTEIDFEDFWNIINNSSILIDDQKNSIKDAISSYKRGRFLSSLRELYPVLEGTLNLALEPVTNPEKLKGMVPKTLKLKENSRISSDLEKELTINARIRNKIVHGSMLENDPELVKPLIPPVLNSLKRLVSELDENKKLILP